MPEEENKKPSQKSVDIDTSGPGAEIDVAEEKVKEEGVVETEAPKTEQEPEIKVEETKEEETETVKEIKKEQKQDDEQLEEYSKGVQSRISKLTRKMREAERQRDAATEYARAADDSRKTLEKRFVKTDSEYIKKFESSVKEGMDSAQKELAAGVKEIGNTNTGPRVDEYAKEARMNTGGKWCGYFANWNYAVAAKDLEGRFKGPSLHSKPKACYSFLYRSYTNDSGSKMRELDTLKANHEAAGSTRQFFVFEGSQGHALAKSLNQPCVVADNYRELDIRPGDTALWDRSHIGMVESYNKETGILTTIEGNLGGRVRRKQYDLTNAADRNQFTGFGRPSLEDFNLPEVGHESSG